MNVSPLVVGIILAIAMILTGYSVFQSTVSGAGDSLFKGDDSLLNRAQENGETENTGLNYEKDLERGVKISRRGNL